MRHQLGLRCSLLALLRAFSDSVLSCVSEKPSTVHREEAKGARRGSIAAAFAERGAPGGAMPRRLSRRRRRTLSGGRRGRVGEAVMTWRLHVLTVHRSQRADFAENAHIRVAGLQFGVASTRASLRVSVSFSSPPGPRAPTTTSRYVGARLNGATAFVRQPALPHARSNTVTMAATMQMRCGVRAPAAVATRARASAVRNHQSCNHPPAARRVPTPRPLAAAATPWQAAAPGGRTAGGSGLLSLRGATRGLPAFRAALPPCRAAARPIAGCAPHRRYDQPIRAWH